MNYLVATESRVPMAKTISLHSAMVIAKALSNEEENLHERIYVVVNCGFYLIKGYYIDGEYHLCMKSVF